jgi:hypothetical protein
MRARRVLVLVAVAAVTLVGCTGGSSGTTGSGGGHGATTTVAGGLPDSYTGSREALMSVLGPPDAFVSKVESLDGNDVAVETFFYAALAHRFDIVNDVVVGDEAIPPYPDGTILPLHISYYDVRTGLTMQEVTKSLEQITLTPIDGTSLGLPDGTQVLAGDQVVIGLLDGLVFYVQTFPLVPDTTGSLRAYLDGSAP